MPAPAIRWRSPPISAKTTPSTGRSPTSPSATRSRTSGTSRSSRPRSARPGSRRSKGCDVFRGGAAMNTSATRPSVPSPARRSAAIVSLATALAVVVVLVLLLAHALVFLVGALVGLLLLAGGGWWTVTERNPRRAVGIAGMVAGAVVICLAGVLAATSADAALVWILVLGGLVALSTVTARAALVPDLHELDRRHGV